MLGGMFSLINKENDQEILIYMSVLIRKIITRPKGDI